MAASEVLDTCIPETLSAAPERLQAIASLAVRKTIGEAEIIWYRAADPGYPANFSRDSLTAAMLIGDRDMLASQVAYSAHYQGTAYDAITGEEPGKIHHELLENKDGTVDGVRFEGCSSAYNACDTTAQFLQAIAALARIDGPEVLDRYAPNIEAAIGYITSHTKRGLFYEMPMHGDVSRTFALKVTYWKDSRLNLPDQEEPRYPITYALVHFQNADGVRAIGRALGRPDLVAMGEEMIKRGIEYFWREDHFATAVDGEGDDARTIDSPSSDSLHALLYIPPELLPSGYALKIQDYTSALITEAGYRSALPNQDQDDYHTGYVWTHEQALLHAAARLQGLGEAQTVASRVVNHYGIDNPELIDAATYRRGGNLLQLWAFAAREYFKQNGGSFYEAAALDLS